MRLALLAALAVLVLALLAAPLAAEAQPAGNRIGYLEGGSTTGSPRTFEALREGLRELGWIKGQRLVIEYRFAEGRSDRLSDLAAELVRLKVDVIVAAGGTAAAVAAKDATGAIPIVMANGGGDPVDLGSSRASRGWWSPIHREDTPFLPSTTIGTPPTGRNAESRGQRWHSGYS